MTTEITRRAFLTEPGEPLLLARSTMEAVRRRVEWLEVTVGAAERAGRITAEQASDGILSTSMVSVPLPVYAAGTGRQFPNVDPQIMWHPLFWLPDRLGGRYALQTPEGEALEDESASAWAVRVALELSASGLYDAASGTWVDVLARVGLDVEDPVDLARVEAWQAGHDDPALDSIDLTPDLEVTDDPHWALDSTEGIYDDLERAAWALAADDLAAMTVDVRDPQVADLTRPGATHQGATLIVDLARSLLGDVPWPIDELETREFWDDLSTSLELIEADDDDSVLQVALTPAVERLYGVRDKYWPHLDALSALVGESREQPVAVS